MMEMLFVFCALVFQTLRVSLAGEINWSECSKRCGSGSRHDVSNSAIKMSCDDFDCDLELSRTQIRSDILFIVDNTQRVGEMDYWNTKQMMLDAIDALSEVTTNETDRADVRFACITFDKQATVTFDFNAGFNLNKNDDLREMIWNLKYAPSKDGEHLESALYKGAEMFDQQSRPSAHQYVLMISYADDILDAEVSEEAFGKIERENRKVTALFPRSHTTAVTAKGNVRIHILTYLTGKVVTRCEEWIYNWTKDGEEISCSYDGMIEECPECGIHTLSAVARCKCIYYGESVFSYTLFVPAPMAKCCCHSYGTPPCPKGGGGGGGSPSRCADYPCTGEMECK